MRRILIARSAGFCFGVKRAISMANDTAGTYEKGRIRNFFLNVASITGAVSMTKCKK